MAFKPIYFSPIGDGYGVSGFHDDARRGGLHREGGLIGHGDLGEQQSNSKVVAADGVIKVKPEIKVDDVIPPDRPRNWERFNHPWRTRSNGDDTVAVEAGRILWWEGNEDPIVLAHRKESTDSVTVTGTGYIYYSYIPQAVLVNHNQGASPDSETYNLGKYDSSGAFSFESSLKSPGSGDALNDSSGWKSVASSGKIWILLAEVSLIWWNCSGR